MDFPVDQLLSNLGTLKRLKQYVFDGELVDVLTDAELSAAREALLKARVAEDKRSQVWSAINHLEAAHNRLKPIYDGKSSFFAGTDLYRHRMLVKDQWVLCLMAVCYRALDEDLLCRRALRESREAPSRHSGTGGRGSAGDVFHPRFIAEGAIYFLAWANGSPIPDAGLDTGRFEAALL